LPTPGSPISTGLFLVRRTGPDHPADLGVRADHRVRGRPCGPRSVRSTPYFSRAL
jgi:hypothetical protein